MILREADTATHESVKPADLNFRPEYQQDLLRVLSLLPGNVLFAHTEMHFLVNSNWSGW